MTKPTNSRRDFFKGTAAASIGLTLAPSLLAGTSTPKITKSLDKIKPIWRNKQDGVTYRMMGRTGMMASEIVLGTFPFTDDSYDGVIDYGIDQGINYIDTAPAYSNGQVEATIGNYLKKSGNRDKVFLSTKLSFYYGYIDRVIRDIEKGLPQGKKDALLKKANAMIEQRSVMKPGYHMNYFTGQEAQFPKTYYRHLMLQEYGFKSEWRAKIKQHAYKLLEDSLRRLQTDHLDVLHCPHGIAMPEMMDDEVLQEVLAEFKQKGLISASAVSFHNDVAGHLAKAIEVDYYDITMFAYNIANHAALENLMFKAKEAGIGMVAMKVAKLLWLKDQPEWRLEKLNTAIPEQGMSKFSKAYLWALQNPNLSACVSEMHTKDIITDNLKVMGRKVDIQTV
ncbi:aldo/keto reductase [Paraglaciecola aquimarina]|uniref:Aldo/keto reductase n=1 Tax=Paraglaciecola algarum TaxID=3050085 RepID=A0ABS9DAZ1_9ALTE|nr:aldo/keto reductase [Paraglaciecola sp. G1-23]MCF2950120.1 aldo/keto reductase [Paraglaciecola sp. G1-23]